MITCPFYLHGNEKSCAERCEGRAEVIPAWPGEGSDRGIAGSLWMLVVVWSGSRSFR